VDSIDYTKVSDEDLMYEIELFCDLMSGKPFTILSERAENLYDHKAIEHLEKGNPLRVTTVDIPFLHRFQRRPLPKDRYEEEGLLLWEWFLGAHDQIQSGIEPDNPPPHLLEDDPLIIRQIALQETSHYIIVTDDMAMLRKAQAKVPGVVIIQINCFDLFMMTPPDYSNIEEIIIELAHLYNVTLEDTTFLVDTGSVEAFTELRTTRSNLTSRVAGIPWKKDTIRRNMKILPMSRHIRADELKRPIRLGYPQKGFQYRRGR